MGRVNQGKNQKKKRRRAVKVWDEYLLIAQELLGELEGFETGIHEEDVPKPGDKDKLKKKSFYKRLLDGTVELIKIGQHTDGNWELQYNEVRQIGDILSTINQLRVLENGSELRKGNQDIKKSELERKVILFLAKVMIETYFVTSDPVIRRELLNIVIKVNKLTAVEKIIEAEILKVINVEGNDHSKVEYTKQRAGDKSKGIMMMISEQGGGGMKKDASKGIVEDKVLCGMNQHIDIIMDYFTKEYKASVEEFIKGDGKEENMDSMQDVLECGKILVYLVRKQQYRYTEEQRNGVLEKANEKYDIFSGKMSSTRDSCIKIMQKGDTHEYEIVEVASLLLLAIMNALAVLSINKTSQLSQQQEPIIEVLRIRNQKLMEMVEGMGNDMGKICLAKAAITKIEDLDILNKSVEEVEKITSEMIRWCIEQVIEICGKLENNENTQRYRIKSTGFDVIKMWISKNQRGATPIQGKADVMEHIFELIERNVTDDKTPQIIIHRIMEIITIIIEGGRGGSLGSMDKEHNKFVERMMKIARKSNRMKYPILTLIVRKGLQDKKQHAANPKDSFDSNWNIDLELEEIEKDFFRDINLVPKLTQYMIERIKGMAGTKDLDKIIGLIVRLMLNGSDQVNRQIQQNSKIGVEEDTTSTSPCFDGIMMTSQYLLPGVFKENIDIAFKLIRELINTTSNCGNSYNSNRYYKVEYSSDTESDTEKQIRAVVNIMVILARLCQKHPIMAIDVNDSGNLEFVLIKNVMDNKGKPHGISKEGWLDISKFVNGGIYGQDDSIKQQLLGLVITNSIDIAKVDGFAKTHHLDIISDKRDMKMQIVKEILLQIINKNEELETDIKLKVAHNLKQYVESATTSTTNNPCNSKQFFSELVQFVTENCFYPGATQIKMYVGMTIVQQITPFLSDGNNTSSSGIGGERIELFKLVMWQLIQLTNNNNLELVDLGIECLINLVDSASSDESNIIDGWLIKKILSLLVLKLNSSIKDVEYVGSMLGFMFYKMIIKSSKYFEITLPSHYSVNSSSDDQQYTNVNDKAGEFINQLYGGLSNIYTQLTATTLVDIIKSNGMIKVLGYITTLNKCLYYLSSAKMYEKYLHQFVGDIINILMLYIDSVEHIVINPTPENTLKTNTTSDPDHSNGNGANRSIHDKNNGNDDGGDSGDDDDDDDDDDGVTDKLMVSTSYYSWKLIKYSSELITEVVVKYYPIINNLNQYEVVETVMEKFRFLLLTCKHKGTFLSISPNFKRLCSLLSSSSSSFSGNRLINTWIHQLIADLDKSDSGNRADVDNSGNLLAMSTTVVTRRSAGYPYYLLSLISCTRNSIHNNAERVLYTLLLKYNESNEPEIKVLILNLLRILFDDKSMFYFINYNTSSTGLPHANVQSTTNDGVDGNTDHKNDSNGGSFYFKVLESLLSPTKAGTDWSVNNAINMLFSSLLKRLFGNEINNPTMKLSNTNSLYKLLVNNLSAPKTSSESCQFNSVLLSRYIVNPSTDYNVLFELLVNMAINKKHYMLRKAAAKSAILLLLNNNRLGNQHSGNCDENGDNCDAYIVNLLTLLHQPDTNNNSCNGILLVIYYYVSLLGSFNENSLNALLLAKINELFFSFYLGLPEPKNTNTNTKTKTKTKTNTKINTNTSTSIKRNATNCTENSTKVHRYCTVNQILYFKTLLSIVKKSKANILDNIESNNTNAGQNKDYITNLKQLVSLITQNIVMPLFSTNSRTRIASSGYTERNTDTSGDSFDESNCGFIDYFVTHYGTIYIDNLLLIFLNLALSTAQLVESHLLTTDDNDNKHTDALAVENILFSTLQSIFCFNSGKYTGNSHRDDTVSAGIKSDQQFSNELLVLAHCVLNYYLDLYSHKASNIHSKTSTDTGKSKLDAAPIKSDLAGLLVNLFCLYTSDNKIVDVELLRLVLELLTLFNLNYPGVTGGNKSMTLHLPLIGYKEYVSTSTPSRFIPYSIKPLLLHYYSTCELNVVISPEYLVEMVKIIEFSLAPTNPKHHRLYALRATISLLASIQTLCDGAANSNSEGSGSKGYIHNSLVSDLLLSLFVFMFDDDYQIRQLAQTFVSSNELFLLPSPTVSGTGGAAGKVTDKDISNEQNITHTWYLSSLLLSPTPSTPLCALVDSNYVVKVLLEYLEINTFFTKFSNMNLYSTLSSILPASTTASQPSAKQTASWSVLFYPDNPNSYIDIFCVAKVLYNSLSKYFAHHQLVGNNESNLNALFCSEDEYDVIFNSLSTNIRNICHILATFFSPQSHQTSTSLYANANNNPFIDSYFYISLVLLNYNLRLLENFTNMVNCAYCKTKSDAQFIAIELRVTDSSTAVPKLSSWITSQTPATFANTDSSSTKNIVIPVEFDPSVYNQSPPPSVSFHPKYLELVNYKQ
ncbi:hypothetical protein AX774_g5108 [Zancudomyces culisetae]|uniref:DUF2428 domain-containing protein n=1 Tax=Zancudomyces culisetae TaxID=1213189 RepID=A0A1R1PKM0_ZANCU|nr:hypothetical protein AX774_g5108 [Zancudomyces culisetae]|eukprot:OMH81432.1 hypothetical protein AX774_g5108 [Zancudomyces culisetae]